MAKTYEKTAEEIVGSDCFVVKPKDGPRQVFVLKGGPDGTPVSPEIQAQIDAEFERPPTQDELDAEQDARLAVIENNIEETESSDAALYTLIFDLENRVRALEGVEPMTKRDFKREFRKQLRIAARKAAKQGA